MVPYRNFGDMYLNGALTGERVPGMKYRRAHLSGLSGAEEEKYDRLCTVEKYGEEDSLRLLAYTFEVWEKGGHISKVLTSIEPLGTRLWEYLLLESCTRENIVENSFVNFHIIKKTFDAKRPTILILVSVIPLVFLIDLSSLLSFNEILTPTILMSNNPVHGFSNIIKYPFSRIQRTISLSFEISGFNKDGIPSVFICPSNIYY
jgi:hypothetical protein